MKIRLLQDLNSRELIAGKIIYKEIPEADKGHLVEEGKAEIVEEKKVKRDKNSQ